MKQYKILTCKFITVTCLASLFLAFTACKNDEDLYLHNKSDASQTAFADEVKTEGFTFTAKNNWTATVKEFSNQKNNDVTWLKLLYNEIETYSGSAGTFSMGISLEMNYSGQTRMATIEIMSENDKITVTVTQSGTTKNGEVPEPEPIVIDLTNAIWGDVDIATLKIFSFGENLLVETEVAQTGYKITLPNPEKVPVPLGSITGFGGTTCNYSDPNTKCADIGLGPIPYNSNGKQLGGFELRSGNHWFATYFYVDRDCNVTGTFGTVSINCYLKKGWNIYYIKGEYKDDIWINILTTEKPAGENFEWGLFLWMK